MEEKGPQGGKEAAPRLQPAPQAEPEKAPRPDAAPAAPGGGSRRGWALAAGVVLAGAAAVLLPRSPLRNPQGSADAVSHAASAVREGFNRLSLRTAGESLMPYDSGGPVEAEPDPEADPEAEPDAEPGGNLHGRSFEKIGLPDGHRTPQGLLSSRKAADSARGPVASRREEPAPGGGASVEPPPERPERPPEGGPDNAAQAGNGREPGTGDDRETQTGGESGKEGERSPGKNPYAALFRPPQASAQAAMQPGSAVAPGVAGLLARAPEVGVRPGSVPMPRSDPRVQPGNETTRGVTGMPAVPRLGPGRQVRPEPLYETDPADDGPDAVGSGGGTGGGSGGSGGGYGLSAWQIAWEASREMLRQAIGRGAVLLQQQIAQNAQQGGRGGDNDGETEVVGDSGSDDCSSD